MANATPTYSRAGAASAHHDNEGVTLCDLGAVDTSATIDCSKAKLFYAASITGTITLTFTNVPVGDEVILDLVSHGTPPTVTWTGVAVWLVSAPTWSASKTTRVRLLNNGHQVVGSFLEEYHT
jgi:hypothetical protein